MNKLYIIFLGLLLRILLCKVPKLARAPLTQVDFQSDQSGTVTDGLLLSGTCTGTTDGLFFVVAATPAECLTSTGTGCLKLTQASGSGSRR